MVKLPQDRRTVLFSEWRVVVVTPSWLYRCFPLFPPPAPHPSLSVLCLSFSPSVSLPRHTDSSVTFRPRRSVSETEGTGAWGVNDLGNVTPE